MAVTPRRLPQAANSSSPQQVGEDQFGWFPLPENAHLDMRAGEPRTAGRPLGRRSFWDTVLEWPLGKPADSGSWRRPRRSSDGPTLLLTCDTSPIQMLFLNDPPTDTWNLYPLCKWGEKTMLSCLLAQFVLVCCHKEGQASRQCLTPWESHVDTPSDYRPRSRPCPRTVRSKIPLQT